MTDQGGVLTTEELAGNVKDAHDLSSLHIFDEGYIWRVFGFRRNARGFQSSVEWGRGATICDAIIDLNRRLVAGPGTQRNLP